MKGVQGNLALETVVHKSFSIDEWRKIVPITPPEPYPVPLIDPGMPPSGSSGGRPPIPFLNLDTAYHKRPKILVLDDKDKILSSFLDYKISDIADIHSVVKSSDAAKSMLLNNYDLVSVALGLIEGSQAGLTFAKNVKVENPNNDVWQIIQKDYQQTPLMLCNPKGEEDVLAVFLDIKGGMPCHVFPYSAENYITAVTDLFNQRIH